MPGIAEAIAKVAELGTSVTNEISQNERLKNDPKLQTALYVQRVQEKVDELRKDIADENVEELAKIVAAPVAGSGS